MVQITISLNEKQASLLEITAKRKRLKNASVFVKRMVEQELEKNLEREDEVFIEEVLPGHPDWDMVQKLLKKKDLKFIPFESLLNEPIPDRNRRRSKKAT